MNESPGHSTEQQEAAAARFDEAFTARYNERGKEPVEKHY